VVSKISFMGAATPGAKRVNRTGIALVHENEIIYPAVGSEAQAVEALEDARSRIEVYFPVVIEIRSAVPRHGSAASSYSSPLDDLETAMGRR
jgi:hypothetical protein